MSTTSLPNQIRIWLSQNTGWHKPAAIAEALGAERKQVSSALSRLVKQDRIVREDGAYGDPSVLNEEAAHEAETQAQAEDVRQGEEPVEEPEEDLIGEPTEQPVPAPEKSFDLAAMKDKIAKLLAKAERTDNEHERDAFNSQAERLMLKLGIARAELESAGEVKPEEIVEVVREWKGNYSIVMVPFVANVAEGFGNLTILQSTRSAMLRKTFIIGHKTDVEEFVALIDSLALQVLSALHRWQKEHKEERRGLTDMEKYVQHRSFISGFGLTVSSRLAEERKEEEQEASTGAALVLASKESRIKGWLDEKYPKLGTARGGMQQFSSRAARDGAVAGRTANLGNKSVGGKTGELSK